MSLLLLLLLVLPLSNCESSKETVKDDRIGTMYTSMSIENKFEELEKKLETKNAEVENLQEQLKDMKVQFAEIESRMEGMMLSTQKKNQNHEGANLSEMTLQIVDLQNQLKEVKADRKNENQEVAKSLKSEMTKKCKAEVKKELEKSLPTAVEQGLRDLPYEMVCAYKEMWYEADSFPGSVISYDRITLEFNNSNQPGGADGTMDIETGVFTTVTSGYYIITFSGNAYVEPGEYTEMWLHHNGVRVEESQIVTSMLVGDSGDAIGGQGSRTVVSTLIVFNC